MCSNKSYHNRNMHTSTDRRGQLNPPTISLRLCVFSCKAVLWIRDVYPGSEFFPSRIPHPNFCHQVPRIRIEEFKDLNPKNCFQAFGNMIRVILPRSGSRTRISFADPCNFGTDPDADPDPRIHTSDQWIRMMRIRETKKHLDPTDPDADPQHWSGYWFFTHPGSQIKVSKRHRIPDPHHCCKVEQSVYVPAWRRGLQQRAEACVPGSIPTLCAGIRHGFPHPQLHSKKILLITWNSRNNQKSCVADPDPNPSDPYVFGSPGSGSSSQRYGSGSELGSFYHQANSKKNLHYCCATSFLLFICKKWCKCNLKK